MWVLLSAALMTVAAVNLVLRDAWLAIFLAPLAFTVLYRITWLLTVPLTRGFDLDAHLELAARWSPLTYPSVDVFLPVCGERTEVVANTWNHVAALVYPGEVRVHVLDDGASPRLMALAEDHGFVYHSRPNRGWMKKAGNLRYGYERSNGDFIAIFDADFCPRPDLLTELLPHFDADRSVGIVQSPQFFRPVLGHNWLERGAGASQEPFYAELQTKRDRFGAAICVGSNAIYRRQALLENGGNALVEYSEDVHTGIELRRVGWHLRYVPVNLATGLCPEDPSAFFVQQYRWARGCLGLRLSGKFWSIPMPISSRLAYVSGPLFHFHQLVQMMLVPGLTVAAVLTAPHAFIGWAGVVVLSWPGLRLLAGLRIFGHPIRRDASRVRLLATWASLYATLDFLRGSAMAWQPTGGRVANVRRFQTARLGLLLWNGGWALAQLGCGITLTAVDRTPVFLPLALLGALTLGLVATVWRDAGSVLPAVNRAGRADLGAAAVLPGIITRPLDAGVAVEPSV